jgi:hypothetical protein
VENKTLPLAACRLSAEVADVGKDSAKEGDATKTPVRLVARSTEPVQGWWGAVYHDLAGMQIELPLPLDYCHEYDEIVGAAEKSEITDEGLICDGFLISLAPLDRADEVVKKSRAAFPIRPRSSPSRCRSRRSSPEAPPRSTARRSTARP